MEIKTTVQRVFEDGSFETLAFPSQAQASVREEAADPVQQGIVSALEFRADNVVTFDLLSTELEPKLGAGEPDSGASMLAGESAKAPLLCRRPTRLHRAMCCDLNSRSTTPTRTLCLHLLLK